jgi:protein-S-isoprenylcysteine O-methyltransferase Ste14
MTRKTNLNKQEKVRVSAPTLTIIHLILAILLRNLLPLPTTASAGFQWLGLGLAGFGLLLGLMALSEFKRARLAAGSGKHKAGLLTSGIYRYTRNPVYLGFVFLLIGSTLSMGTFWGLILAWSLVVLLNNLVIKPEESSLEKRFKDQYLEYKSKVRRWV